MLSNFIKSTLLSLIIIDILLVSITISAHSDCNLCKALLPPTLNGQNYIITHVPALIPYNFAQKLYHDPYLSTITSKLIPVTITESLKRSKHDKFVNRNVHNDNGENLAALIYQHDIQMNRPIDEFFQALPKLQQQSAFSYENDRLGFDNSQQSPLTINDDNADLDKINDYNVALMGYGDDVNVNDNQQVQKFNDTLYNAYNAPINNAYITPSDKILNEETIRFHDYPIKYGGITYDIKLDEAPKLPVSNENAYRAPLDSYNMGKLAQLLFGMPLDNSYQQNQADQRSQIQINADEIPNDSFKMTTTQFNDYGVNDYNIPYDTAQPDNADIISHNDEQSKITINAYSSKISPENADATPFNNNYKPVIPPSPISFNANPINAYNADESDEKTINADVISQNSEFDESRFDLDNDYNPLSYTQEMDKQTNSFRENADNIPPSDQSGKLSTIEFDSLLPSSPYSLDRNKPSPITLNSYSIHAYSNRENADTTLYNDKPEESPIIQFNDDYSPPSPYSLQMNEQSPISINANPINAYNERVVITNDDESNIQTINSHGQMVASTQNLDNPQFLTNADEKASNDQLTMQFNASIVNADDLPQPVLYNVDPSNNDFNQRNAVSINNADDINDEITKSNDDEFIYPPPDADDGSSSSSSRISNSDYEGNPIFNADDYNNNDDNSANDNDKEHFFGGLNDLFDFFGGVKIDKNGLNERLTDAQPIYENDKITTSNMYSQFNENIPKDTDVLNRYSPISHENAHIKVDKVYNITQNIKVTEVTNAKENNADDSFTHKINNENYAKVTVTTNADENNAKTTVTQYADSYNVASVKPTQSIPESALKKHADEKKTIIQPNQHNFMLTLQFFTKNHNNNNKTPNNIDITSKMMKNDEHYQTMKTTNLQKLKKLGLLTLHLFKYLNADERMSNDQIIQHTITDVINGKTDDIINDPEIHAYIGWKFMDLNNINTDDSEMLTALKMNLMKILNNSKFNELKSFLDKNQNHQMVTHKERATYQKKCDCKFEPVVEP